MQSLIHSSGGLIYHLYALRYSRVLWKSTRQHIRRLLTPLKFKKAVLVGPSGGYLLDKDWLASFKEILIIEPDPLARLMLRRKLPTTSEIVWSGTAVDTLDPKGFRNLLRESDFTPSETAVIFCNVFGQIDQKYNKPFSNLKDFFRHLDNYCLVSIHEEFSTDIGSLEAVQRRQESLHGLSLLKSISRSKNIIDHGTQELFDPAQKSSYFYWTITPKRLHLMVVAKYLVSSQESVTHDV